MVLFDNMKLNWPLTSPYYFFVYFTTKSCCTEYSHDAEYCCFAFSFYCWLCLEYLLDSCSDTASAWSIRNYSISFIWLNWAVEQIIISIFWISFHCSFEIISVMFNGTFSNNNLTSSYGAAFNLILLNQLRFCSCICCSFKKNDDLYAGVS